MDDELTNTSSPSEETSRRDDGEWSAQWFALDPAARVVVQRNLTVLAANKRAKLIIERTGLAVRDGALAARDRRDASLLNATVSAAGSAAVLTVIGDGGAAVLVEAMALGEHSEAPVALTLRDLSQVVEIECADLEPMFGVTPGERQVIVHLLQGLSSREIADRSGKSILTIRTHVKRAYGKIGVKTRGQLFARLLPYLSIR